MKKLLLSFFVFVFVNAVNASVTLPGWMTSDMVLQQQTVAHLKGTAKKGATVKITASWDNLTTKVQADKQTGAFDFDLRVPRAGGPYTLTFDDGTPLVLNNVMAGEVWFCSGQSNMQMPLHSNWASVQNWEQEVADATHPMVRLFQVDRVVAHTPQTKVPYGHTKGWAVSSPDMAEGFSAAADEKGPFHFAAFGEAVNEAVKTVDEGDAPYCISSEGYCIAHLKIPAP